MKEQEIIEFECPECGCKTSYKTFSEFSEAGECTKCGALTYYKKIKDNPMSFAPTIVCPYCKSTNTKKISSFSKAKSVALFGMFAIGKTTKQWHCNNCKSDF